MREGFPPEDLCAACRRKLRRGMAPAQLPIFLQEMARWPGGILPRAHAQRLIAAGLAHGLPDEEVASFGGFVARNSMDERDAVILARRLEENLRRGRRGRILLAESLEDFSGAIPSEPSAR